MAVRPGRPDAQLFWLALPGRGPGRDRRRQSLPAAPEVNCQAMVDKVLSELRRPAVPPS